jgi:putative metallohydrolase (TIGR04338 family)
VSLSVYRVEGHVRDMMAAAVASGIDTLEIHGSTITIPPPTKLYRSIEDAQAMVDLIWAEHGTGTPPKVRKRSHRGGATVAHATRYEIALNQPKEGMSEETLLHEVAHCLTPGAHHRYPWQQCYTQLVAQYLTPELAFLLQAGFAEIKE